MFARHWLLVASPTRRSTRRARPILRSSCILFASNQPVRRRLVRVDFTQLSREYRLKLLTCRPRFQILVTVLKARRGSMLVVERVVSKSRQARRRFDDLRRLKVPLSTNFLHSTPIWRRNCFRGRIAACSHQGLGNAEVPVLASEREGLHVARSWRRWRHQAMRVRSEGRSLSTRVFPGRISLRVLHLLAGCMLDSLARLWP